MKLFSCKALLAVAAVSITSSIMAAEVATINMRSLAFSSSALTVKLGSTVRFLNEDPVVHTVSWTGTDGRIVDLGQFSKGEAKTVTMSTAGTLVIGCDIHPSMKMRIRVE